MSNVESYSIWSDDGARQGQHPARVSTTDPVLSPKALVGAPPNALPNTEVAGAPKALVDAPPNALPNTEVAGAPKADPAQEAINTIAAALIFNELSPEDGYDAFDADEDGQVSLSDLQSAVTQLQLEISEQNSASLFESLDADKTGFIPKAAWLEAIAGAKTEDILKSKGVVLGGQ